MKRTIEFSFGRDSNGWVRIQYRGFRIEAKVYEENSEEYGINGGNISKLWIQNAKREVVYNYDRGHDIDNAPAGLVQTIVKFFAIGGEGYDTLKNKKFFSRQ